jgi:hypothetical protein
VPRGVDADGLFKMIDWGLTRRSGRSAPSLVASMVRATDGFVRVSKTACIDGCIGVAAVDNIAAAQGKRWAGRNSHRANRYDLRP